MDFYVSPFFGIALTVAAYLVGQFIHRKTGSPLLNPLLICIFLCIAFLKLTGISYEEYAVGGRYISFLIAPATVVMVVGLYKNLGRLMKNLVPILGGILVGSVTSIICVVLLSKLFGFDSMIILSIMPKSITAAVGAPLAAEIGGDFTIAIVGIVITGMTGAVIAPFVIKLLRVEDEIAIGVGIGTSSHAVGTSKALEIGEVEGAMSGLALAIAAVITVVILPIIGTLFGLIS